MTFLGDQALATHAALTAHVQSLAPALGPSWLDPGTMLDNLIAWLGPWALIGVCAVIFAETGLLIGFFLPGDSLLFTLGVFVGAAKIGLPLWVVLPALFVAAVVGNSTGYLIGYRVGPRVFDRPDSRFFKREYVNRTHTFFEKHGGKAIILAQFVPIVRTFTPVAAGVGRMNFRHFISFNMIGALLWAVGVTTLGYWLGGFEFVKKNIELMLLAIVFVSILPMLIEGLKHWLAGRRSAGEPAAAPVGDVEA